MGLRALISAALHAARNDSIPNKIYLYGTLNNRLICSKSIFLDKLINFKIPCTNYQRLIFMAKKRGYFFVLDAALALFVLVIGVFIIASLYLQAPRPMQVSLLSDDLMGFLARTKIRDLNNQFAGIGGSLWKNGTITDADNTALQQIGEFYATNKMDTAEKFIQNVSENVVPPQYTYELWMDNNRLYPRNPEPDHFSSKSQTNLMLTSKRITFGVLNQTTSSLWGPYKVEVYLWEK